MSILKQWQPNKRQEALLQLPDTVFEALFGGAAGAGKSEILVMLPIVRKFYEHSRFKGLLLRRTYPELERELIIRSQVDGYYAGTGAKYNDQKKYWVWPSGARLQFGHMEFEKDVKIYDTAEYNYIGFDEVTSFTPFQYEYLTFSRCRSSDQNLPAIVRSGTNPGGVSHNYFRDRFVKPCPQGNSIISETKTIDGYQVKTKLIFIPAKVQDNPYLLKTDPTYFDRLNRLPEAERLAKAAGDWWSYTGQVFDEFRINPLPGEPLYAKHVCSPFNIPEYWPRVLSIDWGFSALTVAGFYAINPVPDDKHTAKIYKFREYSARKTKISEWARDIKNLVNLDNGGLNYVAIVMCRSAFGQRGDEMTIAEQFMNSSGLKVSPADNDRLAGKLLIQDYLSWKPVTQAQPIIYDDRVAERIYRLQGVSALERYKDATQLVSTPLVYTPLSYPYPKLQIFDTCEGIINHLPLCIYSKTKPEDVEEFHNDTDDFYDELRYGLKACQYFLDAGADQVKYEQEVAKICNRVDIKSQSSITKFYMDMEKLEKRETLTSKVRRYGHSKGMRHANF
jgi:Terminase large subunit, T4likevirus-type, N-terminal